MEDNLIFIREVVRVQITSLLLADCLPGVCAGAFLHNGKAQVKRKDRQMDRLVFGGLTWEGKTVPLPQKS